MLYFYHFRFSRCALLFIFCLFIIFWYAELSSFEYILLSPTSFPSFFKVLFCFVLYFAELTQRSNGVMIQFLLLLRFLFFAFSFCFRSFHRSAGAGHSRTNGWLVLSAAAAPRPHLVPPPMGLGLCVGSPSREPLPPPLRRRNKPRSHPQLPG